MCCFATAHHDCGHIHQWFARCFSAKASNAQTCHLQSFPTWKYQEPFPCPACRSERRAEVQELNGGKRHHPTPPQPMRDDGPTTVRAGSTDTESKQQIPAKKAQPMPMSRTLSDPNAAVVEQYLRQVLGPPGSNPAATLQHENASLLHQFPVSEPAVPPGYNHQVPNTASPAQMVPQSALTIPQELNLPSQAPQAWRSPVPPLIPRQYPPSAREPGRLQNVTIPTASHQPEPGEYTSPYAPVIDPRLSNTQGRAEESPGPPKKR